MALLPWSKPDPELARIASALESLVHLYKIDLTSRGLTLEDGNWVGEILLDNPEAQALAERNENVRTALGLPSSFEVGAVIPGWDSSRGVELPSPAQEKAWEATQEEPAPSGAHPGQAFSPPWGHGPEGAEAPEG